MLDLAFRDLSFPRLGSARGGGELASTTMTDTVSYNGVTFTLNQPMPVGNFVTGEPFVVSTEAFQITAVSPASGDIEADTYVGHGMMQNPYLTGSQGFDAYIAEEGESYLIGAGTPYNAALNVDPAINGPISISAAEETSFVKSIRLASVTDPDQWQTIEKYVPLHVLAAVPFSDSYPPSVSATTKTLWRRSDINLASLRSVTMPFSLDTDAATALSKVPSDLGLWAGPILNGNRRRRFRLDSALGTSIANYSGGIADHYARLMLLMHSDAVSTEDRLTIIDRVVRFGIHIHGLVQRGYRDEAEVNPGDVSFGAGQSGGVGPWPYMAAFLLNDADILESARLLNTNMTANGYWSVAEFVGADAPGKSGSAAQIFLPEGVGHPFIIPDEWGSNHDTRYGHIAAYISAWEHLPVLLLQNGPGGISGLSAILDGTFDNTNQRAASVAHLEKFRSWSPYVMGSYVKQAQWDDIYDTVKSEIGLTPLTFSPEQLPYGGDNSTYNDDYFTTPSDGAIAWNIAAFGYATEAITQIDARYSLDGVQWVEVPNVLASDSISGLVRGAAHWVGLRRHSASGISPWLANYPYSLPITSGTDRSKITTTGTASAAAPAFTTNPKIFRRTYPLWDYKTWAEAETTMDADDMVEGSILLSAGVGYYTGHPAATATYQWKRDGSNISGATAKEFTATQYVDGGTTITCTVTLTNASGSVNFTTAGTDIPVEVEPAAPLAFERVAHSGGTRVTRTGGFINATDGKAGAFGWKGRLTAGDGTFRSILVSGTTNRQISMQIRTSGNNVDLQMRDASNNIDMQLLSTNAITVSSGELIILAAWDVATATAYLYVNDSNVLNTATDILTNDVLKFATTQTIGVLSESDGSPTFDGETDYVWFDDQFVDLSDSVIRAKFGDAEDLGAWGRGPTGNRPLLFAWGNASSWNGGTANKGRGGIFTATGTFTDA